jgi:hypothetical protein
MATFSTQYAFKQTNPTAREAMQCVFVSKIGEIHQVIISVEDWPSEIRNVMTRYAIVNCWKSIIHTITIV